MFVSGQIPLDPRTGEFPEGTQTQVNQVFANLSAVCAAAGATPGDVVRLGIYLVDLVDFALINETMGRLFAESHPARATVQVAALPKGARIEVEAVVPMRVLLVRLSHTTDAINTLPAVCAFRRDRPDAWIVCATHSEPNIDIVNSCQSVNECLAVPDLGGGGAPEGEAEEPEEPQSRTLAGAKSSAEFVSTCTRWSWTRSSTLRSASFDPGRAQLRDIRLPVACSRASSSSRRQPP